MIRNLTLTLCLTQDCTLRCRYCYAGRKRPQRMSWETAEAGMRLGLAEARRTGCALDLTFFGGEPLLEWDMLRRCTDWMLAQDTSDLPAHVRFGVTTNCTLLTPDKLPWLEEHDFKLGLSVDGSPAMHDINRCFPDGSGSHAAVEQALIRLREYPKLRSEVICVVTPNNVQHLAAGVAWLHAHYDGAIALNFDYWCDWSDADFATLRQQYDRVMQHILATYRDGKPLRLDNFEDKVRTHLYSNAVQPCVQCRIGEREIAVSTLGSLFPCSRLVGRADEEGVRFGDVMHGIDRSAQLKLIAVRGNRTAACALCSLRHRCSNSCGCSNLAASGHWDQVSPFLCNCEKMCIHAADAVAEQLYAERNPAFMNLFYPQECEQ